jgi:hypothetical protein
VLLAGLAVGLLSCGLFASSGKEDDHESLRSGIQGLVCGVERWSVKTGTDADVDGVDLDPQSTDLDTLISFPHPGHLPPNNRVPEELQVYQLTDVTLTDYRLESDSDYHLVLFDGASTMIAEIPDPGCVDISSPFLAGLQSARATFDGRYLATRRWRTANIPVTIIGAGFFDFFHNQRGLAPNAFELHAVLGICFETGCQLESPVALSSTTSPTRR